MNAARKYDGGTDDRVQTAAAFLTLLRELGEARWAWHGQSEAVFGKLPCDFKGP